MLACCLKKSKLPLLVIKRPFLLSSPSAGTALRTAQSCSTSSLLLQGDKPPLFQSLPLPCADSGVHQNYSCGNPTHLPSRNTNSSCWIKQIGWAPEELQQALNRHKVSSSKWDSSEVKTCASPDCVLDFIISCNFTR